MFHLTFRYFLHLIRHLILRNSVSNTFSNAQLNRWTSVSCFDQFAQRVDKFNPWMGKLHRVSFILTQPWTETAAFHLENQTTMAPRIVERKSERGGGWGEGGNRSRQLVLVIVSKPAERAEPPWPFTVVG